MFKENLEYKKVNNMTWEDILKLSYSENMKRWNKRYYEEENQPSNNSSSKTFNLDGKTYKMNPQQEEFYNKQKEELKQDLPKSDEKQLHRIALRRTVRQYSNLQEA